MKRKRRKLIIGCDSGLLGGICIMDLKGRILALIPMPVYYVAKTNRRKTKSNPTGKGKPGKKGLVDYMGIVSFICKHVTSDDEVIGGIEEVTANSFGNIANWGMSAGLHLLIGIFAMAAFSIWLIRAAEWQKIIFGAKRGKADKQRSIAKAKQLWPSWSEIIGNSDGMAEAALVAEATRRKFIGAAL